MLTLNNTENIPLSENIAVVHLSFTCIPLTSIRRYRQLADRRRLLDFNNISHISYIIQPVESLSRIFSTRFELLYTNMYYVGPSDGAVSRYALRLEIYRATFVLMEQP